MGTTIAASVTLADIFLQQQAGHGDMMAEFGTAYEFVLFLCVLNTIWVLYYVWGIFKEKPEPLPKEPEGEQGREQG